MSEKSNILNDLCNRAHKRYYLVKILPILISEI